jgi:hypothetical protein
VLWTRFTRVSRVASYSSPELITDGEREIARKVEGEKVANRKLTRCKAKGNWGMEERERVGGGGSFILIQ